MGKPLADAFPICRDTLAEADAALGESLSALIDEGPEERLTLTENAQPAILAVSTAACRLLVSRGIAPAYVAGHSLGEYSANVAAGTVGFADALRIVRRRGRYMQEAVPVGAGAMAAILGLDAEVVAQACREAAEGDVVSPANLNGAGQVRRRARAGARRQTGDFPGRERAVSLRADGACGSAPRAGIARARDARTARADRGECRRRAEARRGGRDRSARGAGGVAGAMGSGRDSPCVGRRHNVC